MIWYYLEKAKKSVLKPLSNIIRDDNAKITKDDNVNLFFWCVQMF